MTRRLNNSNTTLIKKISLSLNASGALRGLTIKREPLSLSGQRIWVGIFLNTIYIWPRSTHRERCSTSLASGKCKHYTRYYNQKNKTDNNKCWWGQRNWNPHAVLIRMQMENKKTNKQKKECKWYNHLENSLGVSENMKHRVTVWPSNTTARFTPQRNENRFT